MIIGAITLLRILFYRRGAKDSCTFFLSLSKRTGQARTPPDAPRCWAAAGALSLSLAAMPAAPTDLVVEADLLYEEDILRNAYSLKYWWRYMQAKHRAPARQRNLVAERALKFLPGCYKIWAAYLRDRHEQVAYRKPGDPALDALARTYERALVYMHKMPRLWLDYLSFLSAQPLPTETRAAFDRALKALPVTQHERIWEIYLAFAKKCPVTETAVRIYRRYLQFEPEGVEEYVEFLLGAGRVGEAALKLAELLNQDSFVSTKGKSRHQLWMQLCELVCKHPMEVKQLRVEAIIRSGLRTFSDEAGHLWCALADYFIRLALFEQASAPYAPIYPPLHPPIYPPLYHPLTSPGLVQA